MGKEIEISGIPGQVTKSGLILPADLSFDEWEEIGQKLNHCKESVKWWIGDWLAYGEHTYGEKYAQAIEATGYDPQTLYNASYVSKAIPYNCRDSELPWSYHECVAPLKKEERAEMLEQAKQNHWNRDELRQQVRQRKGKKRLPDESEYELEVAVMCKRTLTLLAKSETSATRKVIQSVRDNLLPDDVEVISVKKIE